MTVLDYIKFNMEKSLLIFSLSLLCCCTANLHIESNESEKTYLNNETSNVAAEQTILGDTIEIPYTVDNLLKALEYLPSDTKALINKQDICATHYYVRFHPKNAEELALLEEIKPRLMLSEIPLDREIVYGGNSYHDPSLPHDMPTYQYTTIEADYWKNLSDTLSVESEILLEAYMPDYFTEEQTKSYKCSTPYSAIEELLHSAYEITGHEYIPETKSSEWNPSGTIQAYDNITNNYVPIKGVRVRGTYLLTIKETLTDKNGYFCLGSFKNTVNMKIVWEGENWDVRDGNLGQANYEGPKLENTQWNLQIKPTETDQLAFSAIHRAAYRYYCDYIFNLSRPDNSRREKLAYIKDGIHFGNANGDYNQQWGLGIWSDIRIAGKNSSGIREISEIFCTTCHELGHASHYTNAKAKFKDSETRVIESWARFTQYLLTKREYNELGIKYLYGEYSQNGVKGDWPDLTYNFQNSTDRTYTPLLIDLFDGFNQFIYFNDSSYADDRITNISPSVIEGIVFTSTSFIEIFQQLQSLKTKYGGPMYNLTDGNIELLFQYYL